MFCRREGKKEREQGREIAVTSLPTRAPEEGVLGLGLRLSLRRVVPFGGLGSARRWRGELEQKDEALLSSGV